MKRISLLLVTLCVLSSSLLHAKEDIQELATQTDATYRQGAAAIDGAYTSLSMSMLGWGAGLAAGFGILVAVLHNSTTSHSHCD